jgi:hypothetical protein
LPRAIPHVDTFVGNQIPPRFFSRLFIVSGRQPVVCLGDPGLIDMVRDIYTQHLSVTFVYPGNARALLQRSQVYRAPLTREQQVEARPRVDVGGRWTGPRPGDVCIAGYVDTFNNGSAPSFLRVL